MGKREKKRFLQGYVLAVVFLGALRLAFPGLSEGVGQGEEALAAALSDTVAQAPAGSEEEWEREAPASRSATFYHADGSPVRSRVFSVPSFERCFPDSQALQLAAANRHGVSPVQDREEAERRKQELVYIGCNPFFHVDKLNNSIPYLVPRASVLLQDIGRAFFDSLYVKDIPLHKVIVTSVLRTKDDVERLRRRNGNATENSCHLYGTTFDICYNRYLTVEDPAGPRRRAVRNDTLKWVLSEVLRDFRSQGRCYIKYEKKQGCFHMTVR